MPNPRYAVSVVIENGESGGAVAGPVAIEVLKSLLMNKPFQKIYFDPYLFFSLFLLSTSLGYFFYSLLLMPIQASVIKAIEFM